MRHAAEITVGIAGNGGSFTAFVLRADIPGLLRKGAAGGLCRQLDLSGNVSTLGPQGVDTPMKVNCMGHHVLGAMTLRERHVKSRRA